MCKEIAPLELFNACNKPTSSIFSSSLPGSPVPEKRPKRVPPVPSVRRVHYFDIETRPHLDE